MKETKTVKYYYSEEVAICNLPAVLDKSGNILYVTNNKSAVIERLPRITVASVYDYETNVMRFGVAVCSPEDMFERRIGRQIAVNRAHESPKKTIVGIHRDKIRETSKKYAKSIIDSYLAKYASKIK